jgi:hypothetical protein
MEGIAKLFAVVALVLGFLALITGAGFLFAYPTMWLVNYLFTASVLTAVFGVSALTVWKAWALNILAGLLLKSTSSK